MKKELRLKEKKIQKIDGHPVWDAFFRFFDACLSSKKKLLIAVSGGSDSMLISFLVYHYFIHKNYPLKNLLFVHCDHSTRKESREDALFLENFFQGLPFSCVIRPSSRKTTEEALRIWRYEAFQELADIHKADFIIFGHHLNDRVESTFLHLLRGSHLNGFLNMREKDYHPLFSHMQVLRPLLSFSKGVILDLCKSLGLPYLQDASNINVDISKRNFLRNRVLPQLFALSHKHSSLTNTFLQSLAGIYTSLDKIVPCGKGELKLSPLFISPFWSARFAFRRDIKREFIDSDIIVLLLKKFCLYSNVSSAFIWSLTDFLLRCESGYKYFRGVYFFVSHNHIYIISASKNFWQSSLLETKKIQKPCSLTFGGVKVSLDNANSSPGILRFPQQGDRYKGKAWNQFASNKKIPLFWRNFIPVFEKDGKIVQIFIPPSFVA